MSTVEAIRFRHLVAQLTTIETKHFISKLFDVNTNIILTALFHYITKLPPNTTNDINTISNLVSNIILSRNKKPKAISTSNMKLNELPQPLIGATASFLKQNDYVNLSKCSRSIFIGCNAPNKIQTLDLSDFKQYSNVNLTHFPSITKLSINLNKVNQLMYSIIDTTKSVCNELTSIILDQKVHLNFGSKIVTFMEKFPMNLNAITHLTFKKLRRERPDEIWKTISKFQNISYLGFSYCYILSGNMTNIPSLPKLRGLSIIGSSDECKKTLLHLFGHQLESFQFDRFGENDCNLSTINFAKLEELVLKEPSLKTFIGVINTAKNLRQTDIYPKRFMEPQQIKEAMKNVIGKCQVLQHIKIEVYNDTIAATLEGIESGILETMKRKRNSMRIVIDMDPDESFYSPTKDILAVIERIVLCLEHSNTDEFMLVFIDNNGNFKSEFKINISTNVTINSDEFNLCIMNKQCKINGYTASWKLPKSSWLY